MHGDSGHVRCRTPCPPSPPCTAHLQRHCSQRRQHRPSRPLPRTHHTRADHANRTICRHLQEKHTLLSCVLRRRRALHHTVRHSVAHSNPHGAVWQRTPLLLCSAGSLSPAFRCSGTICSSSLHVARIRAAMLSRWAEAWRVSQRDELARAGWQACWTSDAAHVFGAPLAQSPLATPERWQFGVRHAACCTWP